MMNFLVSLDFSPFLNFVGFLIDFCYCSWDPIFRTFRISSSDVGFVLDFSVVHGIYGMKLLIPQKCIHISCQMAFVELGPLVNLLCELESEQKYKLS